MTQLGILFDSHKLGSGFYGYTAFRILFSVATPRDLLGCTLYHGEIGDGRTRPYCIAIESADAALLARLKQAFSSSVVRGLLPADQRFMDELALQEEVLATAGIINRRGEMTECSSRWLQEAWQRAQGQHHHGGSREPSPAPNRPAKEHRSTVHLPERAPLALRCSPGGRKALAFLLAFCIGGALIPWVGWSVAACVTAFAAGLVGALGVTWQLRAAESLSGEEVLVEAKKLIASKPLNEALEKLNAPGPAASPMLRCVQISARGSELQSSALLAEQQHISDRAGLRADIEEIQMMAFSVAAVGAMALSAIWVLHGSAAATALAAKVTFVTVLGFCALRVMAKLIEIRANRFESQLRRLLAAEWLPTLSRASAAPAKASATAAEPAIQDLSRELHEMRNGLNDTMSGLRTSIDHLTPVLAGFREPFVLQAVPTAGGRPKALSASA